MIPFANTWPYEKMMQDLYVSHCPFCSAENVLLPFKLNDLHEIRSGVKKWLIFPCCHARIKVVDADADYLLSDRKIRM